MEHVDEQSRHADLRQRKVDIILSTLPLEEHGYHNYKLFEQDLVMVFSTSHPHISGSSITAEQFFSEQHILWNTHRMDTDTLDSVADTVLPKRRIAYKTSSALTGIVLAGDTDWLCVNARSIAEKVSRSDRFQICELPFKAKAVPIYMTWHHSQRSDR
ncbi:LysR substrate-binding domain-containing protein [Vibrio sp. 10N.286.49.B1]|uniref:LysR substrate-binding domain-containing protein n=1 Tax=unclassified Vibrio TaxID=2614977 RepID=UPI002410FF7E|nr:MULTISPECIES: LysR substrate-binding domain-containing protein [unclassified Vibrio]